MSKRPKELFEPGELDKTRRNLGTISPQEAKKMAEILGGEIGIERTDAQINKRYEEFAEQNRRKRDSRLLYPSQLQQNLHDTREDSLPPPIRTKSVEPVKQSYIQRIKLALIAYHGAYRIKSFSGVAASFFSFLPGYKNKINPFFIKTLHSSIYKHIEQFTTSTRVLYRGVENKEILSRKDPYSWRIIKTIMDWDIEALEKEIGRLKTFSRTVSVEACSTLLRKVYTPLILFSKVDAAHDIKNALEYLYTRSIAELPLRHVHVTKLRKRYILALGEIDSIFTQIKFELYPLLLLLISPKAYSYRDLLKYEGKQILLFLEIKTSDLISYKAIRQEETEKEREKDQQDTDTEAGIENEGEEPFVDIGITQGLFFLENLFPGTGWLKLKNKPDMFPAFQPILDLPSDFALISPDDPLQKVVILAAVLKELFFGFRSIEYGFIRDEKGTAREIKDIVEEITGTWHLFLTTLMGKHYITTLTEYCRQLERDGTFINSDYAQRMEADLLWLRKKYIFQHMYLDTPKIMQPRLTLSVPKLYNNTRILKDILQRMVLEVWNTEGIPIETILNPEQESVFEVDTEVSKKLKAYFKKKNKPFIHKNLVLAALNIVLVLDYLLNHKQSPAYTDPPDTLFRSEGNLGFIPVYAVMSAAPESRQSEKGQEKVDPHEITGEMDKISGFPGSKVLGSYLKQQIQKAKETGEPFTLIQLETRDYHLPGKRPEEQAEILQQLAALISDSIRQFEDIPIRTADDTLLLLLPETEMKGALKFMERFFHATGKVLPCFAGIVEYREPVTETELRSSAEKALTLSKSFPAPMLTYVDPETGAFSQTL